MVWLESFTLHSTNLLNHVMIMLLQKIFSFLFASFAIFAVCLLFFVSTFCITFWTVSMFTHLILLMKKKNGIFYIYIECILLTLEYMYWKCVRVHWANHFSFGKSAVWAADFIYFLPIKKIVFPNYVRANEISCTNYL